MGVSVFIDKLSHLAYNSEVRKDHARFLPVQFLVAFATRREQSQDRRISQKMSAARRDFARKTKRNMPERSTTVAVKPAENVKPTFEGFLAALSARDRLNIERHIGVCDAEATGDHAKVFKRLACTLAGLAPQAVRTTGQRA